jgi:hypothetical protein
MLRRNVGRIMSQKTELLMISTRMSQMISADAAMECGDGMLM